jgi:hypothetical protein
MSTANALGAIAIVLINRAFFKKDFISSVLNQIGAIARYKDDKAQILRLCDNVVTCEKINKNRYLHKFRINFEQLGPNPQYF